MLTVQKQLITLCHEGSSMSLYDLHRESSSLLRRELNQIGFNLGVGGDLERVLYPHFLSHPIGIGQSLTIPLFRDLLESHVTHLSRFT